MLLRHRLISQLTGKFWALTQEEVDHQRFLQPDGCQVLSGNSWSRVVPVFPFLMLGRRPRSCW